MTEILNGVIQNATLADLAVKRVDTAVIGGDFTGNARGANAIDIQGSRTTDTQVASGANSVAIGVNNTASDRYAVAIGFINTASDTYAFAMGAYAYAVDSVSTAIGAGSYASGFYSIAIGGGRATVDYSIAFGYYSRPSTPITSFSAPLGLQKSAGIHTEANSFKSFGSTGVVLGSLKYDGTTTFDATMAIPAGLRAYIAKCHVVTTSVAGLTIQPTIRFGVTGNLSKHVAATLTTDLTATHKIQTFTPLTESDGETSLTAGVTVAATATTFDMRFLWELKILIEEQ